jgi:hypothetical protein
MIRNPIPWPIRAPRAGWEIFAQEFEAAHKFGGLWVPVLHPFATARLARWRIVEQYLIDIRERTDVWFAPMEEIADHVNQVVEKGDWLSRTDKIPYYHSAVVPARVG